MKPNILWIILVCIGLLAACTPVGPVADPTPTIQPTERPAQRPTIVILNACDYVDDTEMSVLMGEPMTVFEETPAGQITGEFSFISRCELAGFDPASEARLTLLVIQPKPGLDTAPIEEIGERYIAGMEQAGISQYESLPDLSPAAFWLPETQTMTVFQADGTGVTVTIQPEQENARQKALEIVTNTLAGLGY